ncbi:uncharacterized protein N7459_001679 [Penicillium hispanicum]|uniref:uncharacterized protein n=1 Tax=Penicillium hispanicum TaxID=1080232 RepID=UPI0025419847|nr:uncharacterized protein N7459_001679 [Penicillium hispanicum]KAJ5595471.1 hypothetical protein N7459_001679 [Penicillium hispanicum]
MDDFLLQNAARHQKLVKLFKPPRPTASEATHDSSSSNIVVATRIRPILDEEITSGQVVAAFPRAGENGVVDLHELRRVVRGPPPLNSSSFKVGKVFGADRSTQAIYEDIVQPLLPWALEGNVGTLFAYGQTGSGKTYTVSGLERLIAESLVDGARERGQKLYICMFELAGSSAYDLLNSRSSFSILEDSFGHTQLAGVKEHHISSPDDLLCLIEEATSFRKTATTEKNDSSSRSHAICRIRIENPPTTPLEDGVLYLIDLAGSEAARDMTQHSSDRLKETRDINMSLSVLKDCIRGMAGVDPTGKPTSKKPYIPFRQSMLTKVLKHVFDPSGTRSCRTAVLACINPSFLDTSASKNTLRYAEMLRSAQPNMKPAGYNPANPGTWSNKDLRNYIRIKSGNPSILPSDLAPHESGAQLLRLPADTFVRRCLKTDGVTAEQANAFRAKLWQLHIDSQHRSSEGRNGAATDRQQELLSPKFSSSRVTVPDFGTSCFKERIRPGMVVHWNPPADFPLRVEGKNLAVVLCPQNAVGEHVSDALGNKVNRSSASPQNGVRSSEAAAGQQYLCALVLPGTLADTYEVGLWRQFVVNVEQMEDEVLLEYDSATRYYHIAV